MSNYIQNHKLGSDPEVFIFDKEKNEIISAIGIIPGFKINPFPLTDKGHFIQTDNIMTEFCVPETNNAKEFYRDFQVCLVEGSKYLNEHQEFLIKPSAHINMKYLADPKAREFGCDPDYNAWTSKINQSPKSNTNLRTCGGHIHVGYDNPDNVVSQFLIKAMDLFLGVPSILLDRDIERRKMYGKAGAHRMKSYGTEYRVLSNFWLADENLVNWAFKSTQKAIDAINRDIMVSDTEQTDIQMCINQSDVDLARKLCDKYNLYELMEECLTLA